MNIKLRTARTRAYDVNTKFKQRISIKKSIYYCFN